MLRQRIVSRLARLITAHPTACITATLAIGCFFALQAPRLSARADVDDFIVPTDPDILRFKETKPYYRRNEMFVILFQDPDLFRPDRLRDLAALTTALEDVPGVHEVLSLANVIDLHGTADGFAVEPFLRTIPTTPSALEKLRQRAIHKPLYLNRLISRDGTTTGLAVFLPDNADGILRRQVIEAVEALLHPYENKGLRFHLVGWPVTNVRLIEYMNQDVMRFIPITMILVIATIFFVFRNARLVFLGAVGILFTVGATLGWAAFFHIPLNNASVAVIPLVMALSLSDIVHLFSHLDRRILQDHPDPREALRHVLEQILFPCMLTTLNTAIGFLSFTTNRIPAIQSFGWLATMGMVFEFLFAFGLVAPLLLRFDPLRVFRDPVRQRSRAIPRVLDAVYGVVVRRPIVVLVFCLMALAWGGFQMRRVQVETDMTAFFRKSSPIRQDADFMKAQLGGIETMIVEFASTRDAFKEPAGLEAIDQLANELARLPGVDHVISAADYFKEMNKAFHAEDPAHNRLPATRRLLEQYLLLYNADDLDEVLTPGFDRTRIVMRLRETSSRANKALWATVHRVVAAHPVAGAEAAVIGDSVNVVKTSGVMVGDQLVNIAQAVGGIWVVMLIVLRSVGLATLFLVPNLFPIVLNFGIMGWLGIPIDTGTALISASAFGIIVDDTVHFFTRFAERRQMGWDFTRALEEVTREKGEALLSSFVILSLGFGVLVLAQFVPVVYFGLLNVIILTTGFAGDMFLLKSLMVLWGRVPPPTDPGVAHVSL